MRRYTKFRCTTSYYVRLKGVKVTEGVVNGKYATTGACALLMSAELL